MADYTDDLLTGGTPSADGTWRYPPSEACDDNALTFWDYNLSNPFPHWWKYDFGVAVSWNIEKLTIKGYDPTEGLWIKDFTLQGSNNDSDWDVIYTGQMANNTDVQTFTFTNNTSYRYYKVNITTSWDDGSYPHAVGIHEFEMMRDITIRGGFSGFSPYIF